jgi:hypothetical protein
MTTPTPVTAPVEIETVQQHMETARSVSMEPEFAAAVAYVTSALPVFEAGLPIREAWRTSPVTPRPDVEDFPVYPTVDALLALANAQNVAGLEIPTELAEPFLRSRECVNGYVAEIARAKSAKEAIAKLTPKDTVRHPQLRGGPFWPESGRVYRVRKDLSAMGLGADRLTDASRALAQSLERLLVFARNTRAAGVRQAAATVRTTPTAEPETELYIKPRH